MFESEVGMAIVGCEGGAETRDPRQQSRGEAKGASDRLGETVYCWASSKGWSHCWFRSLIIISCYLLYLFIFLPSHAFRSVLIS